MEAKVTRDTFGAGAFVNSDGIVCLVKDFMNARMEQKNDYTIVQLCDSEGGVDWEYMWYPSFEVAEEIIKFL